MSTDPKARKPDDGDQIEESGEQPAGLYALLRDNKKWWLGPILLVVLLLVALVVLSSTQTVPFMYRLVRADETGRMGTGS